CFRLYCISAIAAIVLIGIYLWYAYRAALPAGSAGTAADPLRFMSSKEAPLSVLYSAIRGVLYFASYLWEWGVLIWLLTGGAASRIRLYTERRWKQPAVRYAVFIASVAGLLFIYGLPLRVLSYALGRAFGVSTLSIGGWVRDL